MPEWQRLDVKPGMTGEWQVNGRSTVKKFEDVIRMDLDYQKKLEPDIRHQAHYQNPADSVF